jgi:hypothetical protein
MHFRPTLRPLSALDLSSHGLTIKTPQYLKLELEPFFGKPILYLEPTLNTPNLALVVTQTLVPQNHY